MRRPLADTLLDLFGSLLQSREESPLRVTSMSVDLPMEARLRMRDGEWELLADMPQWRWQTGWEEQRGRLRVRWESGGES